MKNAKKFLAYLTCFALLLGTLTVSVGATAAEVGTYEENKDVLSFYLFDPASCPHTSGGEWYFYSYPTATEPGSYAKNCTVCGTPCEFKELPCLKIASASLTLEDSMTLNYKVSKTLLAEGEYTEPSIKFVMGRAETVLTDYREEGDYLVFDFDNIAPHLMTETITATLYAKCYGTECESEPKDYSVAEYCYNMLAKCAADEYAALRTLLVDLLNYGTASQAYVDYKLTDLANASLTAEQAAWGTAEDRALTSVTDTKYVSRENTTVTWKGAGLMLQESVALRFKIATDSIDGLNAKVVGVSGAYTVNADHFEETDGGYYIYFDWLTPAQMSDTFYVTVCQGTTAVSNTLAYSVESYASSKLTSEDAELVALVRAMMRFGDAAAAYVEANLTEPETPGDGWTNPY